MSNYDPKYDPNRADRDMAASRGNVNWVIALAVIAVLAVAGYATYNSHHSGASSINSASDTNIPATGQPTTGRSVAPAPSPGVDTTAPAH